MISNVLGRWGTPVRPTFLEGGIGSERNGEEFSDKRLDWKVPPQIGNLKVSARDAYLTLRLWRTFLTRLMSQVFHLLIRFFTKDFSFRGNFFGGENRVVT